MCNQKVIIYNPRFYRRKTLKPQRHIISKETFSMNLLNFIELKQTRELTKNDPKG